MVLLVGRRNVFVATSLIGIVVSTAVFADCALLLCFPICVEIAREANLPHHRVVLSLALGLTSSHCLIPPTPGPIAAAQLLDADLSLVFMLGSVVAVYAGLSGAAYAYALGRTGLTFGGGCGAPATAADALAMPPGTLAAAAPIVLPVALMASASVARSSHSSRANSTAPLAEEEVDAVAVAEFFGR